jgi:DNA-binding MurR/RpiR family transcriptional regulator
MLDGAHALLQASVDGPSGVGVGGYVPVRRLGLRDATRSHDLQAQGSIASVGIALAHNLAIAGHDAHQVADPAVLANTLAHLQPGDLLVAVKCWQIYTSTLEALQVADSNGVGFFPSLVAALSVAQAIVVELSTIDPVATREALTRAEQQWDNFGLLRHRSQ